MTLTTTADAHVREDSSNNFGTLNNLTASKGTGGANDHRTMYMRFDLTSVSNIEHAVVRLYANQTETGTSLLDAGGPLTVYETSNSWNETTINNANAPALGDPITTTYLTAANQYYDWNITEYAQANIGNEITVAFDIAPSNTLSHRFDSVDMTGGNPGQLLLVTSNTLSTNKVSRSQPETLTTYPNPFVDHITFELSDYDHIDPINVELMNLSGVIVASKTYNQSTIKFENKALASGSYILKVTYNGGKKLIKKLLKVN